jgi:hypothetical protein
MDTNQTIEHARSLRLLEGAIRVLQEEHKRLITEPMSVKGTEEAECLYAGVVESLISIDMEKQIDEEEAYVAAMERVGG